MYDICMARSNSCSILNQTHCFVDGGEVLLNAERTGDCIHDNCMDSTIAEGGNSTLIPRTIIPFIIRSLLLYNT
jgi:hypothetical protein